MKKIYTLLFLLFAFTCTQETFAQNSEKNKVDEESDFVIRTLEKIIYEKEKVVMNNSSEAMNYAVFKSKNFIKNGGDIDSGILAKFYTQLIIEEDFIQRLQPVSKELVINYILDNEKQPNLKKWISARERNAFILKSFVEVFKDYLTLSEAGKVSWKKDGLLLDNANDIELIAQTIKNTKN